MRGSRDLSTPHAGSLLVAGLIAFALLLASAAAVAGQQAFSSVAREPWPSFVMVYRDTAVVGGTGKSVTQTFRLEYRDQMHFKSTLIFHSDTPEAIGYTQTLDGVVSDTKDPRVPTSQSRSYTSGEATVPADWLVPRSTPSLLLRPGARAIQIDALTAVATHRMVADGRDTEEEVVYRVSDGIPTSYTVRVDGRVVRQVQVLELTTSKN